MNLFTDVLLEKLCAVEVGHGFAAEGCVEEEGEKSLDLRLFQTAHLEALLGNELFYSICGVENLRFLF